MNMLKKIVPGLLALAVSAPVIAEGTLILMKLESVWNVDNHNAAGHIIGVVTHTDEGVVAFGPVNAALCAKAGGFLAGLNNTQLNGRPATVTEFKCVPATMDVAEKN